VQRNAVALLVAVNELLKAAAADGVEPIGVASGWRPLAINEKTANSGKHSRHITGQAVDLLDHPDRRLARWCLQNLGKLEELSLYAEDPRWTPTWVHLQIIPPGSGRRVYVPSLAPAMALALPEQSSNA